MKDLKYHLLFQFRFKLACLRQSQIAIAYSSIKFYKAEKNNGFQKEKKNPAKMTEIVNCKGHQGCCRL